MRTFDAPEEIAATSRFLTAKISHGRATKFLIWIIFVIEEVVHFSFSSLFPLFGRTYAELDQANVSQARRAQEVPTTLAPARLSRRADLIPIKTLDSAGCLECRLLRQHGGAFGARRPHRATRVAISALF